MCTPSTLSALHSRTVSLPDTLTKLWQSLIAAGPGPRQAPETLAHLSPHMRRDIGLDDGRLRGRRTAADFIDRHGLAS